MGEVRPDFENKLKFENVPNPEKVQNSKMFKYEKSSTPKNIQIKKFKILKMFKSKKCSKLKNVQIQKNVQNLKMFNKKQIQKNVQNSKMFKSKKNVQN